MKRAAIDEPTSFRRLQKVACEQNLKLVDVARNILVAEAALTPEDVRSPDGTRPTTEPRARTANTNVETTDSP
jgi:hypothetical protein